MPCPEKHATREVVLEREGPGALLGALGADAVYGRLPRGSSAKAQKSVRLSMKEPGTLNLSGCGGASCLRILSLNRGAIWPLRKAGEECRHGDSGEDFLLNKETWHGNVGRCLSLCQGPLAL